MERQGSPERVFAPQSLAIQTPIAWDYVSNQDPERRLWFAFAFPRPPPRFTL
ncbi:hypothetical protein GCWU000324_01012 [Kingella oralis ATCC 51147]|uniref:Uncharacterized protein n=1 Tax=Kingella oralis ATCC 51147 TaxID=629741 RepID=C4GFU5_9NEIS|nr:hypothetical protein GCWU000324_01012 [Kingella oralis ATCC 51147]